MIAYIDRDRGDEAPVIVVYNGGEGKKTVIERIEFIEQRADISF